MTSQVPDILVVEPGSIDLPQMELHGVVIASIDDPKAWTCYKFANKGSEGKMTMCTALWKGYISTYRLKIDGTLVLERLEYPFSRGVDPDEVNEPLQGDFWLDLREWFMGSGVMVPFVDGKIVAEKTHWKYKSGLPARRHGR